MQKHYVLFCVAIALLMQNVTAQSLDSLFQKGEIQVVVKREKYLVGSKVERLDSVKLSEVSSGSLADAINNFLPVYMKQTAAGLSTIRFRGTSPDHTAVLFHGINLNSLTLGHSNMSNIPMFLFDDVSFQFGSASVLYGTDAIGGSINLQNNPSWNKGFSLAIQQDYGSFNRYFTGLKLDYSNKRLHYAIKMFRQASENNFPFLNTAVKDFQTGTFVQDTMQNTALCNYGLLQRFDYKISNRMFFFSNLWLADNFHEIQPNMSANYYGGSYDEIRNRHIRFISGLKYYQAAHKLVLTEAYLYDHQIYKEQVIATNSYISNFDYTHSKVWGGLLNIGFNAHYIKPDVYAYEANVEDSRLDLFGTYKKTFIKKIDVSLNLREAIVKDYESQFAPGAGLSYLLLDKKHTDIDLGFSASKAYKIPTFNDRFWYPNGNPDILPENGISLDASSSLYYHKNNQSIDFKMSTFWIEVDHWIQWVNLDIWRPKNFKKVQSKGAEFSLKIAQKIRKVKASLSLNYTYTHAIEKETYEGESKHLGMQLIYTPKQIANVYCALDYKTWRWSSSLRYTGERFTESYKTLDAFYLVNLNMHKKVRIKKTSLDLSLKINNVFNQDYQNQELFAMPGRSFQISIQYLINNINKH